MKINFAPKDILQIDDARIIFRNFSGESSQYNRAGDMNFGIIIDEEYVEPLQAAGWNVKIKPPREEGDDPFIFLPVKVKFNDYGPRIYLDSNGNMINVTEDIVHILDRMDIETCDLDVRPYDWTVNGDSGRTAYLQSMRVVQKVNRFESRYGSLGSNLAETEDNPF